MIVLCVGGSKHGLFVEREEPITTFPILTLDEPHEGEERYLFMQTSDGKPYYILEGQR